MLNFLSFFSKNDYSKKNRFTFRIILLIFPDARRVQNFLELFYTMNLFLKYYKYSNLSGEMSSSSGSFGVGVGVGVAGGPTLAAAQQSQGVAALLVMLAVLCFIFAYCCWGAPFCRSLCRRHCCCRLEDPEPDSRFGNSDQTMVATPTIILLPHGRMLVVDGTMFTQFQADPTGTTI